MENDKEWLINLSYTQLILKLHFSIIINSCVSFILRNSTKQTNKSQNQVRCQLFISGLNSFDRYISQSHGFENVILDWEFWTTLKGKGLLTGMGIIRKKPTFFIAKTSHCHWPMNMTWICDAMRSGSVMAWNWLELAAPNFLQSVEREELPWWWEFFSMP